VVVDFKGLGGGAQAACEPGGGGQKAWALFEGAGFTLTTVQRTPGFVCRVNGAPASDPCVNTPPADAYWGLWWSDGKSGKWKYSTLGATSLTIPAGGSVALAWDDVDGQAVPGIAPPKTTSSAPSATPSASPTVKPTPTPTVKPTPTQEPTPTPIPTPTQAPTQAPSPSPTPTAAETATPTTSPTPTAAPTPSAAVSPTASDTAAGDDTRDTSAPLESDDGGLPPWVPVAVILLLFGGAAAVVVRRRRG
jgi:hypothetical protein